MPWLDELRAHGISEAALAYYEQLANRHAGKKWVELLPDGKVREQTLEESIVEAVYGRAPWPLREHGGCMCFDCAERARRNVEAWEKAQEERRARKLADAIALLDQPADLQVRPAAVSAEEHTGRLLDAYWTVANAETAKDGGPKRGPREATRELMATTLDVLASFDGSMSTRQVYYQLVSRGAAANNDRSYERVQRLIVAMRRDGQIPYDRIVDRGRSVHQRPGWAGAREIMEASLLQYRRDLWAEQKTIVMVCCEKAALEGVFVEAVDEYGAQLWTIRGFNSESFAFEWATEIKRLTSRGKRVVIAYFGDMDPSGIALERDAREKLRRHGATFTWERHGLLFSDFDDFDLVRVPVKSTDSRAARYLRAFGDVAAELDALDPDELRERVRACIVPHIDRDAWERLERTERVERESLAMVVGKWDAALAAARGAA